MVSAVWMRSYKRGNSNAATRILRLAGGYPAHGPQRSKATPGRKSLGPFAEIPCATRPALERLTVFPGSYCAPQQKCSRRLSGSPRAVSTVSLAEPSVLGSDRFLGVRSLQSVSPRPKTTPLEPRRYRRPFHVMLLRNNPNPKTKGTASNSYASRNKTE